MKKGCVRVEKPSQQEGEERDDKEWFAREGRPSAREVAEKLKLLARRNRPGTQRSATRTMAQSLERARAVAQKWRKKSANARAMKSGKWDSMAGDGVASARWRSRLDRGEAVPAPFSVGGRTGKNDAFELSAVREHLCGGKGGEGRLDLAQTGDAEPGGEHRPGEARANALQTDCYMRSVCLGAASLPLGKTRRTIGEFVDDLRPQSAEGEEEPEWMRTLRVDMPSAEEFWC